MSTTKESLFKEYKDRYFDNRDTILKATEKLKIEVENLIRNITCHRSTDEIQTVKNIIDDLKIMLCFENEKD